MTASCQMNVSQVVFQKYTNNKNNLCKTVKCFNLLQVCPCVPPFVFASCVIYIFYSCSELLFLCCTQFGSTAVSIKIEVASRFDSSNQLYQQEAISPLFLGGGGWSGSMLLQKNSKISNPSNVTKRRVLHFKKCGFYFFFLLYQPHNQLFQAVNK